MPRNQEKAPQSREQSVEQANARIGRIEKKKRKNESIAKLFEDNLLYTMQNAS